MTDEELENLQFDANIPFSGRPTDHRFPLRLMQPPDFAQFEDANNTIIMSTRESAVLTAIDFAAFNQRINSRTYDFLQQLEE